MTRTSRALSTSAGTTACAATRCGIRAVSGACCSPPKRAGTPIGTRFACFASARAVFYDHGRAWKGENQNTVNGGWLRDVGFGLRLLSARTSKGNVLHADFAFPLDPDPSIDRVQFVVKTKVAF